MNVRERGMKRCEVRKNVGKGKRRGKDKSDKERSDEETRREERRGEERKNNTLEKEEEIRS